jgi:chromosome segregation ATPase
MPDEKSLKDQLAEKHAVMNELFKTLQSRDQEMRQLIDQRKKLNDRVEELEKKLKQAEGRLADRDRDHKVLLDLMEMATRSWHEADDAMDDVDAAVEVGDPQSIIREIYSRFKTDTKQARHALQSGYRLKVQEKILLEIWRRGEVTQPIREELARLINDHKQYISDDSEVG